MDWKDIVSHVKVYGLNESIVASGYPMRTEIPTGEKWNCPSDDDMKRARKLANTKVGEGHDQFLSTIIVQFNLSFSVKAWTEIQRYKFITFSSSQSQQHRITKFNLDTSYMEYTDKRIIEIMKEKVADYNNTIDPDEKAKKYLEILYSNPAGFILTARLSTNYRQLKTIYKQRRTHRLPEFQAFCHWIEQLPYSYLITGEDYDPEKE